MLGKNIRKSLLLLSILLGQIKVSAPPKYAQKDTNGVIAISELWRPKQGDGKQIVPVNQVSDLPYSACGKLLVIDKQGNHLTNESGSAFAIHKRILVTAGHVAHNVQTAGRACFVYGLANLEQQISTERDRLYINPEYKGGAYYSPQDIALIILSQDLQINQEELLQLKILDLSDGNRRPAIAIGYPGGELKQNSEEQWLRNDDVLCSCRLDGGASGGPIISDRYVSGVYVQKMPGAIEIFGAQQCQINEEILKFINTVLEESNVRMVEQEEQEPEKKRPRTE